jgi:hypothetical protein
VAVQQVTSGVQDTGQREGRAEPAAPRPADQTAPRPADQTALRPADHETGERSRLSDSIVGLFDRLREAAETHDGD